jgi:hypothetical protein
MESHNFHQQMEKEFNQGKILELIKSEGKTNKQLLNELPFTSTTLAKHLNELLERREIKKEILNGEKVYVLGDKGIISPIDISHLSHYLEEIKKHDGLARYDYSRLWGETLSSSLSWGIISHLITDKDLNDGNIFSSDDMRDVEKLIFSKITHNIKTKKIKKQVEKGDCVIGFSINYEEILKSLNEN